MKKAVRFVCIVLVCTLLLVVPAQAETIAEPRASAFFSYYGTDLYKTSSTSFQIWFDVVANIVTMEELGASEIVLYCSEDQQSWTRVATYTIDNYPEMVDQNTSSHTGYVPYDEAVPGYSYTARITFYAKNSRGIGENDIYTEILEM